MRFCQKLHKISKILCIKMCKFVVVYFILYRLEDQGWRSSCSASVSLRRFFFSGAMVLTPHVTDEFHFDSLRNCSCFYYLLVLCVSNVPAQNRLAHTKRSA